uniref:C2 tensin-type domain-containing protein n=1 Tax=Globodera pallida TaxID=36090 RepID=A0A183CRM0_GLOPA
FAVALCRNSPTQQPFHSKWNSPLLNKKLVPPGHAIRLHIRFSSVWHGAAGGQSRRRVLRPHPPHIWEQSLHSDHCWHEEQSMVEDGGGGENGIGTGDELVKSMVEDGGGGENGIGTGET